MRIGVNSGLAVVARIFSQDAAVTALGDTVNLASRLQKLAEPGTVYLSESTRRLVEGQAETVFAGEFDIKGKSEPQKVYRLDSVRPGATRFETSVFRGLSAYVGRERELQLLERSLADARQKVCIIDVVAEPGMGKSRLLYEFRRQLSDGRAFLLQGSCSPDGRQNAVPDLHRGGARPVSGQHRGAGKRGQTKAGAGARRSRAELSPVLWLAAQHDRPQAAGRGAYRAGRRADWNAHPRDAARALGGALPPVAGRAVDRGYSLDRSSVRRGPEQDRQR